MEKIKSPELISILAANRYRINTLVHMAGKNFSRVNPENVRDMILTILEPLFLKAKEYIEKYHHTDFSLNEWVLEIIELIIDSIGFSLLGNEGSLGQIKINFLKLFTNHISLAFPHPKDLWICLLHGMHNLKNALSRKFSHFTEAMGMAAQYSRSLAELRKFGFVLAWSLGMAAYRSSALTYLGALEPELLSLIFGGSHSFWKQGKASIIEEFSRSPWFLPFYTKGTHKVMFYRTGGFSGDGGFFHRPPSIYYSSLGFIAHDSEHFYRIFCDAFGVQLISIDEKPEKAKSGIQPLFNTQDHPEMFASLNFFESRHSFLLEPENWICNKEAFLFTIPESHYLFIIAKTHCLEGEI
ncbi:MAG: hypothetical protein JXR70_05465 [Spirochaetales bacterium]|nr:hypothetical protein [Spirochaetales bacterium]